MNMPSVLFSILAAGIVSFASFSVKAQPACGVVDFDPQLTGPMIDPLSPTPVGFLVGIPSQFLAQTFTATQDNSTGASVIVPPGFGPGTYTISLFEGTPGVPGSLVASGAAPVALVPPGGGVPATANWPAAAMVPGNPYYILIQTNDLNMGYYTTTTPVNMGVDEYQGGGLWLSPIFGELPLDIYFQIEFCAAAAIVPTLSQWGLILFMLMMVTMGSIIIRSKSKALSIAEFDTANTQLWVVFREMPFDRKSYQKILFVTLAIVVLGFGVAITVFGYALTNADIPGILVCTPVLAYFLFLLREN